MSDVEKYGLVAVVFVGGLLLVIATQGGFGGGDGESLAPEVIDSATPLRSAAPKPGGDSTVRVVSVLPDTPFRWDEPPVPYPGRRSTGAAASGAADGAPTATATPSLPVGSAHSGAGAKGPAARALPGTHVVAQGETLESIAETHLGAKSRWRELLPMNPGLDPRKLQIGQVLRISGGTPVAPPTLAVQPPATQPPAAALAKPAPANVAAANAKAVRTHTVVKGDTLGAIAKKYLGSSARADEIYKANTDVLKSKDALSVGQVLRIP